VEGLLLVVVYDCVVGVVVVLEVHDYVGFFGEEIDDLFFVFVVLLGVYDDDVWYWM